MIAWVTHHLPRDPDEQRPAYHLPGPFIGGAEMTDAAYRAASPVDLVVYGPGDWEQALDADLVVVTGTDLLTDEAMLALAATEPVVFLHHAQTSAPARKALLEAARRVVLHTPAHLEHESRWVTPRATGLVLSPMDPSECRVAAKEPFAVWAQRLHPLKGPLAAKVWAVGQGIPLVTLHDAPRDEVLDTMARAEWYVHLPRALESESRATIEAVLSDCRVHANDLVGLTSVNRWHDREWLAEQVATAGDRFWELVLS